MHASAHQVAPLPEEHVSFPEKHSEAVPTWDLNVSFPEEQSDAKTADIGYEDCTDASPKGGGSTFQPEDESNCPATVDCCKKVEKGSTEALSGLMEPFAKSGASYSSVYHFRTSS